MRTVCKVKDERFEEEENGKEKKNHKGERKNERRKRLK